MKKLVLLFAVAAMTVSASAQSTVYGSKFTDNWSIGVQGGLATKTTQNRWLSNTNPFAGIRLGKDFTPAFGLVAEGNVYFNDRSSVGTVDFGRDGKYIAGHDRDFRTKTFAKSLNVNLLAKVNLTNAIAGYTGEPRAFEVSALYGFGWLHGFGDYEYRGGEFMTPFTVDGPTVVNGDIIDGGTALNKLTSKAAVNFAFNFGADKQFQAFVEPSINFFDLNSFKYNIETSFVQLTAGIVYKFNNSWGTHNFKLAELRDRLQVQQLLGYSQLQAC